MSGVRPRRGPAPRPPATLSTGVPVAGGFSAHTHTRAHHSPLRVCLSRPFRHVDAPGAGSFHPVVLAVPCDPQFSRELHCPRYLQPVLGASLVDAGSPDTQLGVRVPCPQGCRSTGRCGPDKRPRLGSASGEVLGARGRAWGRGGCIGGRANVPGFPPVAGVWPRLRPSVPLQQFQVASRVPVKCGTFAPGRPLSRYANVNSPRLLYCPF